MPSGRDVDVVDDPHPVAEPVGAAPLHRLPDRRQPEGFAGMNGEMRVLPAQVLERIQVPGGRETRFSTGDVEPGDLLIAESDAQLGDLPGPRGMPHGGQQDSGPDRVAGLGCRPGAGGDTVQHRLHHLVQGQIAFGVQLGCEPDLGIDHPVRRQVLDAFGGHPDQRLPGLHHRGGVHERFQVPLQRTGVGGLGEPARQVGNDRRRQAAVAVPIGQVDQRRRPQTAVQDDRAATPSVR